MPANTLPPSSERSERRHDIDWLRVMAVLLLIPFHTARIFDIWEPNYVKNAQLSVWLSGLIVLMGPWHMPLLFVLAGASTWLALRFRSAAQYMQERFLRLMVPFIFGILVIVPPQVYYARLSLYNDPNGYLQFYSQVPGDVQARVERMSQAPGSFLQWYPHFFEIDPGDITGYAGTFTPGAHLWFIAFLYVFSWASLQLFMALKGEKGRRVISGLAGFFSKPGLLLLLVIPLVLSEALPDLGGKNPFTYILLFIYGYILMADEQFQLALERQKWVNLILGALALAGCMTVWFSGISFPDFSLPSILFALLRNFTTCCWVFALLGLGRRYLNRDNKALRYAAEASLPFYILHQTVIVAIGYYVIQWNMGVAAKFLIIAAMSLAGSLLLYELVVRRTRLTRFLFGMKSPQL